MRARRVVLVRHGESEWNAQGRWQGHGGIGLTSQGRWEAEVTAAFLQRAEPDVVGIVTSDLQRVTETSAPAAATLGVPTSQSKAWREIDVGWWSGRTHAEIAAADPDTFAEWRSGADVPTGGGETHSELRVRIRDALDVLESSHPPGVVLVYTHGGPVRAAVAEALRLPPGPCHGLAGVANCSVTVLERHAEHWRLLSYNATAHLTEGG